MPRNGSGTMNRVHDWTEDEGNNIDIEASRMDEDTDDIADEITNSIAKDGQTTPTANLPMGGFRHTGVGNATARNNYPAVGQIQDQSFVWCGTAGGTANALTLSPSPAITAYAAGQAFVFKSGSSPNSDAATLAISGLSTIAIQFEGAALSPGMIEANKWYRVTLDTTSTCQLEPIGAPNLTDINGGQIAGFRNKILNGAFNVASLGTAFDSTTTPANSDDTYLFDQWVLLSDGNDIADVSQEASTIPSGGLYAIKLDTETANKKFGIIQFIEQKDCIGIIGQTATLSFKARKGGSNATLDTLRAAIIAWDGTADSLTSDVVSAWNSEGTDPTLVSNWTYENTPSNLTLTTSYQTFSLSAAIDTASTKNIAVFIWVDNGDSTAGDLAYITDVQLEIGSVPTVFERRPYSTERWLCERYLPTRAATALSPLGVGQAATTIAGLYFIEFDNETRISPTGIAISAAGDFQVRQANGTLNDCTEIVFSAASRYGVEVQATIGAANLVAGSGSILYMKSSSSRFRATGAQL